MSTSRVLPGTAAHGAAPLRISLGALLLTVQALLGDGALALKPAR
ncbi:hypothetical protein [Xanthomonas cassavae]|nr:hypothetical protein [Xanthomonas cassavae]